MSGVGVVKWWHSREAFDDMKWGRYGRGRHIGTGKGSRRKRGVVVQESTNKGCGGRVVVNMTSNVAQWIRGWLPQNVILVASEGGESCWGRIGMFMQRDVNVANRSQGTERHPPSVVILHMVNNLIPESTELVLQFR